MGRTLKNLSLHELKTPSIFNNRFVVELCEIIHVHYRNLRIMMSIQDWLEMAEGMADSLERWKKLGNPSNGHGVHIELCRKEVAKFPQGDNVQVNLNDNLYLKNEDRIFSEGADFKEKEYIHIKIRDLRLECGIEEFIKIANCFQEARSKLKESLCEQSV